MFLVRGGAWHGGVSEGFIKGKGAAMRQVVVIGKKVNIWLHPLTQM